MKKTICITVASMLVLLASTAYGMGRATVYVNNKQLDTDALLIDDRVYVPLRAVSESMGATVSWDNDAKSAHVMSDHDALVINAIQKASQSVVAIVGNYKPGYMSQQTANYNNPHAHGAGVIIKNNGLIMTNAHVVKDTENLTVCFANGESYAATVKAMDEDSDLALVKINKLGLTPITFGTEDSVTIGSTVIAIGTPLSLNMMNSASKGIVSGKNVNIGAYYSFTQSDVAINGGNSGGPLINLNGELIGINSAKFAGIGIEGMSFAIPVETVSFVLDQLEKYGTVKRPDLGLTLSESWEATIGLPTNKGLTVKTSSNTNIYEWDVILAVNGLPVHSITDYNEAIKKTYTGGEIRLTVSRNGTNTEISVTPKN